MSVRTPPQTYLLRSVWIPFHIANTSHYYEKNNLEVNVQFWNNCWSLFLSPLFARSFTGVVLLSEQLWWIVVPGFVAGVRKAFSLAELLTSDSVKNARENFWNLVSASVHDNGYMIVASVMFNHQFLIPQSSSAPLFVTVFMLAFSSRYYIL